MQLVVARPFGRLRLRLAVLRGRGEVDGRLGDSAGPATDPALAARASLLSRAGAGHAFANGFVRGVLARLAAPRLDGRLAAGEDPSSEVALASRSMQLVSRRSRRRLAVGLERASSSRPEHAALSAAVPVDGRAVEVARPAMQQLARALRSRQAVEPRGVALTQILLTEPCSALYRPAYREELYELAREALFALGSPGTAVRIQGQGRR
jgi:hypothetical protein